MDNPGVKDVLHLFAGGSIIMTRRLRLVCRQFRDAIPMPPLLLGGATVDFGKVCAVFTGWSGQFRISCGEWAVNHRCITYRNGDVPAVVTWCREVFEEIFDELLPRMDLYYIVDVPRCNYWNASVLFNGEHYGRHINSSGIILEINGRVATIRVQGCTSTITMNVPEFRRNGAGILVTTDYGTHMWTGQFGDLLTFARMCSMMRLVRRWGVAQRVWT